LPIVTILNSLNNAVK